MTRAVSIGALQPVVGGTLSDVIKSNVIAM
jgi:hypothetical protein